MLPYKQLKDERWDALVIGSGIGGLSVAAVLAKKGKRVLVLERHYTAGGYTHSFERPGYSWDVGVHYIGECQSPNSLVRAAFDYLSDGQLKWEPMPDVYDRAIVGGKVFDFCVGKKKLRDSLVERFPNDGQGIDHYFQAVSEAAQATGTYFAEKAVPRVAAWALGGLMRGKFMRWASRTTLDVLREFTSNHELIGLLTTQWGDYGLPPAQSSFGIHSLIAAHYFNGASYPVGGASQICETIGAVIERSGGKIVVSAEVSEVLVENGRALGVRMSDRQCIYAPLIISDAGVQNTFAHLLPQPQPILKQLGNISPSMAHLSLYVGIKQSASELGLNGTNLWISPSYDHDANLARYLKDPNAPFPMLFISFPSAKDPTFEQAHPGRATIEIVTLAPYDWFKPWEDKPWKRRGADYDALKNSFADRLKSELETYVPALQGKIDYAELSTPLSTRHFMNYERGEAYGLAASPERFCLRALTPQTNVKNLFLTGQDVCSLGVTGALFGGLISASAILGKNMMAEVKKNSRTIPER